MYTGPAWQSTIDKVLILHIYVLSSHKTSLACLSFCLFAIQAGALASELGIARDSGEDWNRGIQPFY